MFFKIAALKNFIIFTRKHLCWTLLLIKLHFFLWEPVNFVWGWLFIIFFIFVAEMFLICSYFPDWTLQCHKEECQTEYNKNTLFHFFHSFSFKQRTWAATGRCSTKKRFCKCAKTNQKIPAKEFNFLLKFNASSLQLY